MNLDRYETVLNDTATVFEFVSEGKIGRINKIIEYSPTNVVPIYNLGFGDKNEITGELDDKIVTDNGDTQKVLATVAASVYVFTNQNPNIWIYATGSSISRNRLYRMGITKFLFEIEMRIRS